MSAALLVSVVSARVERPARRVLPPDPFEVEWIDPSRAQPGVTVLAPVGGRDIFHVGMDGRITKRVTAPWKPHVVELLPGGGLLVLGLGRAARLDPDGVPLQVARRIGGMPHHEVRRSPRGTMFVVVQKLGRDRTTWMDEVVEIGEDGKQLWRWRAAEHLDFTNPPAAATLHSIAGKTDWLHMNSLDFFPNGDLLLSLRNYNQLIRVTYPGGEIVWTWGDGVLGHQHAARILSNGNITMFDNGIYRRSGRHCSPAPCWRASCRPACWEGPCRPSPCLSRAIEMSPATGEIVWSFERKGMFSNGFGDVDRLSNGNTLITYGQMGGGAVVIEVTRDGDVVWKLRSKVTTGYRLGKAPFPGLYRAARIEGVAD